MTHVSIVNKSTLFADADLPALANALQIQVTRDFLPAWGVDAKVFYTPSGQHPSTDHWVLALFDDSDIASALGYHDKTPSGQPLGKAFVRTTLSDGQKVSVTVSHELLEMLGDPSCSSADQDGNVFWAKEAADMVENDEYEIEIPDGWAGAGTKIAVSNFGLLAWWDSSRTVGPYDFLGKLTKPLGLTPGGYMSFLDMSNPSRGWQQVNARGIADPVAKVRARPHLGSRRALRSIPRTERVLSTYSSGTESVPADSGPIPPFPQIAAKESRMKNVDQVTLITTDTATAADYDRAEAGVANLANRNFRTEHLIVQMHVGVGRPTPISPEDQGALDATKTETEELLKKTRSISTQPPA